MIKKIYSIVIYLTVNSQGRSIKETSTKKDKKKKHMKENGKSLEYINL